jgi:hypothetical protein
MMVEEAKDKNIFYLVLVSIVAIVAIVSMVVFFASLAKNNSVSQFSFAPSQEGGMPQRSSLSASDAALFMLDFSNGSDNLSSGNKNSAGYQYYAIDASNSDYYAHYAALYGGGCNMYKSFAYDAAMKDCNLNAFNTACQKAESMGCNLAICTGSGLCSAARAYVAYCLPDWLRSYALQSLYSTLKCS